MGIYSTSQFLGLFAGGSLGGLWMANLSLSAVLVANGALALGWVVLLLVLNFREQKIAGAKSRG
jgi:predicted MFS family arabinose efflux permease